MAFNVKKYKHNFLIFGPQGSGKGTQAQVLADLLKIPHISTGAIFRLMQTTDTPLAREVTSYLQQGKLVPDEVTNRVMLDRLGQADCQPGFILDGYPRTLVQADFLQQHSVIDYVILIDLPDEEGVRRIGKRRQCANGHTYHPDYAPALAEGICDIDGLPLYQRDDETEAAITERLANYHRETEPIIARFRQARLNVIDIDGRPAIAEVSREIREKLVLIPSQ